MSKSTLKNRLFTKRLEIKRRDFLTLTTESNYWWFSRHASKLNYHASEKLNRSPFNKLSQETEIS